MNTAANTTYCSGDYEITKEETGPLGGLEWTIWHGKTRLGTACTLKSAKVVAARHAGRWNVREGMTGAMAWARGRITLAMVGG